MNNSQRIILKAGENVDPDALCDSIADLLESIIETDDSREKERIELLNSILSELRLISQNLRRL